MAASQAVLALVLPTEKLLQGVQKCHMPDERDRALDFIDIIRDRAANPFTRASTHRSILQWEGVQVIIAFLDSMKTDELSVQATLTLLQTLARHKEIVVEFVEQDGVGLLHATQAAHPGDDYIEGLITRLLESLYAAAATEAYEAIEADCEHLRVCEDCSERLQRRRLRSNRTLVQQKIVSKSERLGRVVNYMSKFRSKRLVQTSALDALIAFADRSFVQGKDAHEQLPGSQLDSHMSRLVTAFKHTYDHYIADRWLVWRLYRAIACISHIERFAQAFWDEGVQDWCVDGFASYDRGVKQQGLWALAAMLDHASIFELAAAKPSGQLLSILGQALAENTQQPELPATGVQVESEKRPFVVPRPLKALVLQWYARRSQWIGASLPLLMSGRFCSDERSGQDVPSMRSPTRVEDHGFVRAGVARRKRKGAQNFRTVEALLQSGETGLNE